MNRAVAKAVKVKKDRKKARKERGRLQRGRHRQGSKESDDNEEEEEEEDLNISCGVLALEDEQADAGQVNLTLIP